MIYIFIKKTDEKLKKIGFKRIYEYNSVASYERYNKEYKYTQVVDLMYKRNGKHILLSYDKHLMDDKFIGNTCVGLTYKELKLFAKKMKELKLN